MSTLPSSMVILLLVIALQCLALAASRGGGPSEAQPKVYVTEGQIQGVISLSRNERKFVSFLGIPYAKPPARFEPPEPPEIWEGLRDCSIVRNVCSQWAENREAEMVSIGAEDCLYLNVYMPTFETPSKRLLPVMVFFADENFQRSGPPDKYGSEYLMDEDVILVSLSYRLGAFGFLSTEDGVLGENLGLKDQVMALKWIQGNIHVFGGDRLRVSLIGSGSGSIGVSLHLISPLSAGLFSSVISQSGSFSCSNAIVFQPRSLAMEFGARLGCAGNSSSQQLAACLKASNESALLQAQADMTGWFRGKLVTPFGPTVELGTRNSLRAHQAHQNNLKSQPDAFLPDYPENLVKLGQFKKVPWILGVNSKAGYSKELAVLRNNNLSYVDLLSENWQEMAPLLFHFSRTAESPQKILASLRDFYFFNQDFSVDHLDELFDAVSDHNYFYGVKRSSQLYAQHAPTYVYYFTYQRVNYIRLPEVNGVAHMEELQYFFPLRENGVRKFISKRSRAFEFSKDLISLWTSFAYHGAPMNTWPNPEEWRPLSQAQSTGKVPIKWFRLDADPAYIIEPFFPRVKFWGEQGTDWKLQLAQNQTWNARESTERQRDHHSVHNFNKEQISSAATFVYFREYSNFASFVCLISTWLLTL